MPSLRHPISLCGTCMVIITLTVLSLRYFIYTSLENLLGELIIVSSLQPNIAYTNMVYTNIVLRANYYIAQ